MIPDRFEGVPEGTWEALRRYLIHGIRPGQFLQAVLSNNLIGAIARGDVKNLEGLVVLVRYLVHHAPAQAWGSPEAVAAWIAARGRMTRQAQGAFGQGWRPNDS
jgi:hypothetical protein